MLAKVLSSAIIGIEAYRVEVEVDIARGLPVFNIVGLPEAAVRESRERVKSAVKNSGYSFPADRITVNLAPAHVKKEGTGFDLPIALGILGATELVPRDLVSSYLILGELSLGGRIRPVRGSLPMALFARREGYEGIIVPRENALEAAVVKGLSVLPADELSQVVEFFRGMKRIEAQTVDLSELFKGPESHPVDYSEVLGQEYVKRAIEVAAAGSHNLLMTGSPGAGKTMLARRLPTILPRLTFEEAVETTKIFSIAGALPTGQAIVTERPFRSPHHTTTRAGLTGGGGTPLPGEISLAHNGVLFLDEFPEFPRNILEVLRQPVEDQAVTIARAGTTITFPANFMLVGAMNPCGCGFLGDPSHECSCTPAQIARYRSRISGPLLDRIDIHVEVPAVPFREFAGNESSESSSAIRGRIAEARKIQNKRFISDKIHCNAMMSGRQIKRHCRTDDKTTRYLGIAAGKLRLSARGCSSILKVARTIADLEGVVEIKVDHISEAIQYRNFDRTM